MFTADGKGVPMRRPPAAGPRRHPRRKKGEKANKKQMAYVGAAYTIAPFVRTAEQVLQELHGAEAPPARPKPCHKHVWAEMTRVVEGEPCNGRVELFAHLAAERRRRDPSEQKVTVCLFDGEPALWDEWLEWLGDTIGILDIFHVLERLWDAAYCFHAEGSRAAEAFVTARLRMLLEGKVRGRHQRPAADGDQARAEGAEGPCAVGGGELPGEQPGLHALRRVPGGGLPDRQRCGGGGVPSPGEGPAGADGDALDGSRGAGDAAPAGDVPQRGLGSLLRAPYPARAEAPLPTAGSGAPVRPGGLAYDTEREASYTLIDFREITGVQGRGLAFAGDALLMRMPLEQAQRQLAEQAEVGRAVAVLDATVVLPETYVQLPMQLIFDAPMMAQGLRRSGAPPCAGCR